MDLIPVELVFEDEDGIILLEDELLFEVELLLLGVELLDDFVGFDEHAVSKPALRMSPKVIIIILFFLMISS
jgi:hypothetical protein